MTSKPAIPWDLRVVAWLFIAIGVLSAAQMAWSLLDGDLFLNLGVVGLFIGRGLLRLKPGWRHLGLAMLWIAIVAGAVGVLAVLAVLVVRPASVTWARGARWYEAVSAACGFLVLFWQLHVLRRPGVRQLFEGGPRVEPLPRARAWEVTAPTNFPAFLRSLPELVGEGAVLYLESGGFDEEVAGYLSERAVAQPERVRRAILWPRPRFFHVPATGPTVDGLAALAEARGGEPTAHHLHVYRNGRMLLEWYDVDCGDALFLSRDLPETAVAAFCGKAGSTFQAAEGAS
jgi:hypothetical protein